MAFEWNRIHKSEQYVDSIVEDMVLEQVCDHYGVDDIEDLSADQIDEISYFRDKVLNEFSCLQWGFSNVISLWECQ